MCYTTTIKECDIMGIFNRAIPNIQTNNLNQVRVTPPEEYYVDDIFDPLFNARVKEQLRAKYGNPFLGTVGGYLEGIDNALLGQDDKWGILGSGMGILSGFGRSMDKAGDFIIGGLTESVKGLTGQGFENPLRNIFVEDEDYSGTRLLAAMGNSMAGLAKSPQLTEADFKGLWNIPAMSLELATDPGIMGNAMVKGAKSLNLAKQVSEQSANSNLANIGQLLSDYDDFMAKVSMDLTAPGLRLGAKSLLAKIQQRLGNSSAKQMANIILNGKETPEARMQAQEALRNDSEAASLLEMVDEIGKTEEAISQAELTKTVNTPDLNTAQAVVGMGTAVPTAMREEFENLEDLFEARDVEMIKRALRITDPEYITASNALTKSDIDVLSDLKATLDEEDKAFAEAESELFDSFENDSNIVSNLDVRNIAINRDMFEDYSKLSEAVHRVRNMDALELQQFGINPEYSNLALFPDEFYTDGSFYDITENESTQKAVYRLAGVSDPKRNWALDTPVTLSPSSFSGRSEKSYRKGVQASYTLLRNAFTRAGFPLENYKTPDELSKLFNNKLFKKSFPDEEIRTNIVSDLNKVLFPKNISAYDYMRTVKDLTDTVIKEVHDVSDDSALLVQRVNEYASNVGKTPSEILNTLKKEYTLVPWASKQSGNLKGALRTEFLDDLAKLNSTFNLEKSTKLQKTLQRMYDVVKYREDLLTRAHLIDVNLHLNLNLTAYERGLLTRFDNLNLYNVESIPRAIATSKQYHKFWGDVLKKYETGAKGTPYIISQELAETSENIQRNVLDVMSRKDTAVNVPYNNFFRLNAKRFEDPKYFTKFVDEMLPELAKHYEVKLKAEYFVPKNIPLHKALDKSMPYSTRMLAKRATDILDEFYTLFDDDIAFLLKHNIDPRTPVSKFTRYENNSKIYDTLLRVQNNLGKIPPSPTFTKEIPKNYKAYNFILNKIFPIDYVQVAGKKRPRIIDYYTYSVWDKPFQLQLTEIPTKELTFNDGINIINANMSADYLPPIPVQSARAQISAKAYSTTVGVANSKKIYKSAYADRISDAVISSVQEASPQEAAEIITDFPTYSEAVESKLMEDLGIPEDLANNDMPPDPPKTPSEPPKDSRKILYPKEVVTLYDKLHEAVVASHRAYSGDKATLRTKYVKEILDDANLLMTKKGVTEDAIAKYKRVQTYLNGAGVRKEEFLDTLASSGMFQMAFKPSQKFDKVYSRLQHNVAEVNVAMKSNVLKTFKYKLTNGNTVIGAMWDTSNRNILNIVEKNFKNVNVSKLQDVIRLDKGVASGEVSKYIASEEYRMIDELFDKVRQQEGEYAKMLGFTYDTSRHVKNVRNISPDVGNYLANTVYKDLPINDLDDISDKMLGLPVFKHLRGSWGTRKYDRRFIGYIEDFEAEGMRIFSDDASKIVKGSFGEGSFNNAKFQLYVDLFENDNFKISQYASKPEDLERILYAKLEDGTQSGNLQNLVLAAPRRDASGRIIGFTQFDKTNRLGLQQALNNTDTVLLPSHVFAPLDRVLRKDAKMSNKVFAWVNKHLTLPFKFGVLMNPGFLLGNASDAYLKQATTMAHKYGTSVPEELANVSVAMRDVMVLNNKFDEAYRRFLVHLQAEDFPLAPSNNISELAATDPRIRKMLKDYVSDKLKKSANSPIIECSLSRDERNTIKLWLMLNSISTSASFDSGFQDLDIIAQAMNKSKYQMPKNPVDRILTGKGQYVSTDVSTWGLFANNPLSRKIMDTSESIENLFRASSILNDFRHKGMDDKWFKEYFNTLDELKEAAKSDPKSLRFREELKKKLNVDMTEGINTMHNANFDYERMTDFTDTIGNFVPFPTFFLKNLGYWLDVLVNHPQYIDHAITVQESLWGSRDASKDKFAAEAKGRGAVPINVGGQNLSKFFKGIYKPTPLQSMFGAFSLINNPVEDMYYRLHPSISSGITTASQVEPLKSITADVLPSDNVKYRPYSTDMYERNVTRDDPNFNPLAYSIHRANPLERSVQSAIRLPDKLKEGEVQLSDFLPSIFQPDFGEKYVQ